MRFDDYELKKCLREKLTSGMADLQDHIAAHAEAGVNDLNHRIRPCLNGRTSCQAFFESGNTPAFTERERLSENRPGELQWSLGSDPRSISRFTSTKSVTQFYPLFGS